MNTSSSSRSATPHFRCARTRRTVATSRSNSIGLASNSSHPVAIAFSRSPASACADKAMMGMSWVCELPFRRHAASHPSTTGIEGRPRDFKPELYPQKHGQEDQDRLQRDPHDVGKPTPPLLYGLLAHGEFSLAQQCNGPPRTVSLPPSGAWWSSSQASSQSRCPPRPTFHNCRSANVGCPSARSQEAV